MGISKEKKQLVENLARQHCGYPQGYDDAPEHFRKFMRNEARQFLPIFADYIESLPVKSMTLLMHELGRR